MMNSKELNIFYNPISNLTFDIISPIRTLIYLSSYSSSSLIDSLNKFNLTFVLGDLKNLNYSDHFYNRKLSEKSIQSIEYYYAANLITLNSLFHSDCLRTINFMKRGIHFNLFLNEQVDNFFSRCENLEYDF